MCTDFLLCNSTTCSSDDSKKESAAATDTSATTTAANNAISDEKTQDVSDYVIHSRSMEWADDLHCQLVVQPKGHEFYYGNPLPYKEYGANIFTNCWEGLKQSNEYSYYYLSMYGLSYMPFDGINECGLSMGVLYLPGFSRYLSSEDIKGSDNDDKQNDKQLNSIYYANLIHYILGNFSKVDDIIDKFKKDPVYVFDYENLIKEISALITKLTGNKFEGQFHPQMHWVCYDNTGKGIVIEMVQKQLKIYDSAGVMTNGPPYDWQLTNLLQWQNLTNIPRKEFSIPMSNTTPETVVSFDSKTGGLNASKPLDWPNALPESKINVGSYYGQGYKLSGLPGDWSPPSRFVRAHKIIECLNEANKPKNNETARNMAYHILNSVDIVKGCMVGIGTLGNKQLDYTQWAVIKDLKNLTVSIRMFDQMNWIAPIDLKNLFKETERKKYSIEKWTGKPL